jgi:hypothetical protein
MTFIDFDSGNARNPRGIAQRACDFAELENTAQSYVGMERVSSAAVTGLVLRGVRILCPALTPSAVHLLALLAEHVYQADRWRTGRLRVTASNGRLAHMLGVSERAVRRLLALLEANHWLVRRYNQGNRRGDIAGIDLRPLAARLGDLQQAEMAVAEAAAERRARIREVRDDVGTHTKDRERTQCATQEDPNVRLKSYNINPGLTDLVQGQAEGEGGKRACSKAPSPDIEDDQKLILLMAEASPTLQRQLAPDELQELLEAEPSPRTLIAVSRAVTWLLRGHVPLRPPVWRSAVKRHGWAALAAVLVAVDRQGVRDPAAYLTAMLRSSCLRETVRHNLRALRIQAPGRA